MLNDHCSIKDKLGCGLPRCGFCASAVNRDKQKFTRCTTIFGDTGAEDTDPICPSVHCRLMTNPGCHCGGLEIRKR
jgi:hypothetical protein